VNDAQTVWIVDAHRDGKRFIVRADEKRTAFLELERVTVEKLRLLAPAGAVAEFVSL
jgi:hypothetical protein